MWGFFVAFLSHIIYNDINKWNWRRGECGYDFMKYIADECIYYGKPDYYIDDLRELYQKWFQKGEWIRN